MRRARVAALAACVCAAACASAVRESDSGPPPDTRPRSEGGPTVVGTITPEGVVVADTLPGAVPDTARVDRQTVVTGAVAREPRNTAPAEARPESPPGAWAVQVYAAEDEASAVRVAREAEGEVGVPSRVDHEAGWYKVRVGGFADRAPAEALRARLAARWRDAFLVRPAGS